MLTTFAPVGASADTIEYTETRRTVTEPSGASSTNSSVTTTTSTTTVVPFGTITKEVFVGTLDGRRMQLENAIAAGLASGTISAAQAQRLRARLDEVARTQAAGQTDGLVPLAFTLDQVGNTVHELVPTVIFDPLVSNGRFVMSDGRIVLLDDVMVRRAEIESRISREFAEGKLNQNQVATLRAEMTNIATIEQRMRAAGRSLDYKESRQLYRMFDKVGAKLDRFI
jgi:hypothetical protein